MRRSTHLLQIVSFVFVAFIMQSCSKNYYQVYSVKSDSMQTTHKGIVFANEDCEIVYDLWAESGSLDFAFVNKTNEDIHIDLASSFFIRNNIAYDYFSGKEYTTSYSVAVATSASVIESYQKFNYLNSEWNSAAIKFGESVGVGHSKSVSQREQPIVCVPANSIKIIPSFVVSDYVYLDCDDKKFNKPRQNSATLNYTKENSPLKFRNRIVYRKGVNSEKVVVDNDFWVSSLTNYSRKGVVAKKEIKSCISDFAPATIKYYFKIQSSDKFYNIYKLEN